MSERFSTEPVKAVTAVHYAVTAAVTAGCYCRAFKTECRHNITLILESAN